MPLLKQRSLSNSDTAIKEEEEEEEEEEASCLNVRV
jgi:hypothetical protein